MTADNFKDHPTTVMKVVLRHLFPFAMRSFDADGAFPRPNWSPRKLPPGGDRPEIDFEIKALLSVAARPTARSAEQLLEIVERNWPNSQPRDIDFKSALACPYWRARWNIAYSAAVAQEAVQIRRTHDDRLMKQKKAIKAAADSQQALLDGFEVAAFAPVLPIGFDQPDIASASSIVSKVGQLEEYVKKSLEAIEQLQRLADAERVRFFTPNISDRALWLQTFIEGTGHLWNFLTGETPKLSSKAFVKFVQQSIASLPAPYQFEDIIDWKIRQATERVNGAPKSQGRPYWDRFDRLSAGYKPPDPWPSDEEIREAITVYRKLNLDWRSEIKSIYEDAVSDDRLKQDAGMYILSRLHSIGDKEVSGYIKALRPDNMDPEAFEVI
ncbi:hypothetical protein Msil_1530 [Methylocella silvestris BL2]|uniref:Uncharacterized protein n=1 Tax=Methylocella silvestris (strain DSM 15510 / CIP 108128 / LMG 27833 / NCIMB 13906 / BL2) TaxID=395965 RepID=B8EHZ8_METSB|nr:hypothetical protein [Methylocella silvestris]ACK50480.1 hypothetical protein Msil_1530 [Methylocella silvestris BL2]